MRPVPAAPAAPLPVRPGRPAPAPPSSSSSSSSPTANAPPVPARSTTLASAVSSASSSAASSSAPPLNRPVTMPSPSSPAPAAPPRPAALAKFGMSFTTSSNANTSTSSPLPSPSVSSSSSSTISASPSTPSSSHATSSSPSPSPASTAHNDSSNSAVAPLPPAPEPFIAPYASLKRNPRNLVVMELADTEYSYVESLNVLIQVFMQPLTDLAENEATRRDAPLKAEKLPTLFGNIALLHSLNDKFRASLSNRLVSWLPLPESKQLVSDVIFEFTPYFKMYSQYCSTYEQAQKLMQELSSNSAFTTFVTAAEADPRCQGQKLASLLVKPIQRIPRYKLLLEQLIKNTHKSHPDFQRLEQCGELIATVAAHINESIRRRENLDAMVQLEEKFITSPHFVHPSRHFVRQASLTKVSKKAASPVQCFLFNNLFAYARTVGWKYMLKKKVDIDTEFKIVDSPPADAAQPYPTEFTFDIVSPSMHCTLCFKDDAERQEWRVDFERCIKTAALTIQAQEREKDASEREPSEVKPSTERSRTISAGITSSVSSFAAKMSSSKSTSSMPSATSATADDDGDLSITKPVDACACCHTHFTFLKRRNQCAKCTKDVCGDCSRSRLILSVTDKRPAAVCNTCALTVQNLANASFLTVDTAASADAGNPSETQSARVGKHSLRVNTVAAGHHEGGTGAGKSVGSPTHGKSASYTALSPKSAGATSSSSKPHGPRPPLSPPQSPPHSPPANSAASGGKSWFSIGTGITSAIGSALGSALSTASSSLASASSSTTTDSTGQPFPPVRTWDTDTLCRWLSVPDVGLARYADEFRRLRITGASLVKMVDDHKELPVREEKDRASLIAMVKNLAHGPAAPATPRAAGSTPAAPPRPAPPSSSISSSPAVPPRGSAGAHSSSSSSSTTAPAAAPPYSPASGGGGILSSVSGFFSHKSTSPSTASDSTVPGQCPKCNHVNSASSQKCIACSTPLTWSKPQDSKSNASDKKGGSSGASCTAAAPALPPGGARAAALSKAPAAESASPFSAPSSNAPALPPGGARGGVSGPPTSNKSPIAPALPAGGARGGTAASSGLALPPGGARGGTATASSGPALPPGGARGGTAGPALPPGGARGGTAPSSSGPALPPGGARGGTAPALPPGGVRDAPSAPQRNHVGPAPGSLASRIAKFDR